VIRLVLAEDQAMLRGALAALLAMEPDMQVVEAAGDGESAWRAVQAQRPDLLLTDIEMPGPTGLELAARVQRHGMPTRVVIVTTFARSGYLRRALEAGVAGYLLKDTPVDQLAAALRKVHGGGRAIDPQLALEAWGEADPLSERERQVLRLAGEGWARPASPRVWACRTAPCAITCPNASASSAWTTASRHTGWRGRKAGCKPAHSPDVRRGPCTMLENTPSRRIHAWNSAAPKWPSTVANRAKASSTCAPCSRA
jgi:two-component system response regulator DesR